MTCASRSRQPPWVSRAAAAVLAVTLAAAGGTEASADSCIGNCGGWSPDNCACDAACQGNGNCCQDKCAVCGGCPLCGDGEVDPGERCDGNLCCDVNCAFKSLGAVCRGAASVCDVPESCVGGSATLFSACDPYEATGTSSATVNYVSCMVAVRAGETLTLGTCGVQDASGTGNTYLRLFLGATQVASNDNSCGLLSMITYAAPTSGNYEVRQGCYGTGSCSGTTAWSITGTTCPTDTYATAGTPCRAVAGTCDAAESCTGTSATCPTDQFITAGTQCRLSTGPCDPAEVCPGTTTTCPADGQV